MGRRIKQAKALRVDATPADLARFAAFVEVGDVPDVEGVTTPCHDWTGCRDKYGYPGFKWRGVKYWAHRWICAARKGPLKSGQDVDHVCRNTSCVNPDHLEPKSFKENRGWRRGVRGQHGMRDDQREPMPAIPDDDVPF